VANTALGAALVAANQRSAKRLALIVAGVIVSIWDRLQRYDEDQVEQFITDASPVILAGRRQAVQLAAGFIEAYVNAELQRNDRIEIDLPEYRYAKPLEEVYRRPFVQTWANLAKGTDWIESVDIGRGRVESTARMDVALAHRDGAHEAMRQSQRIVGYRRVLTLPSCDLCTRAAQQRYHKEWLQPLHNNCDCTVEPIIGEADPGRRIELAANSPEGVRVVQHGELGPLLYRPEDRFTELEDI
jgi:hypothetical protein